ncbi:unnamed protein product [Adineta ricciae]|uniref:G-protein coupled receptors family 1 profile domain-containing protein n=2 Tax=Adineta ricciae TaxID=249248 RepID=A0A814IPS1_ADIRI|nr:unnamed protein product [Adineta ricciae]CAF1028885.1 unnamed protein product [Adineta ricciae]
MASSNSSSYEIPSYETSTSRTVKFTIILVFQIISISCSIFLLFNLLTKSALYRPLHNHTIIVLGLISFFQTISDLPMVLAYLHLGQAPTTVFCLLWNFFALSNYAVGIWVMTWASFERHLLIFHDNLMKTSRRRLALHYLPLACSIFFPWSYYISLIFFYPCVNTFYQTFLFCGWCCYARNDQLVFFNWLTFSVIPTLSILFLSVTLIIRVIRQKYRMQQQIQWRQHRHMILQLLSISFLYILFDTPSTIIGIVQLFLPTFAVDIQILYLIYIVYLLPLLTPFLCLNGLHQLRKRNHQQTHPTLPLTQTKVAQRR